MFRQGLIQGGGGGLGVQSPPYRFEMSTKAIFCNKHLVTKDRIFDIILLKNSENLVRKCP